MARLALLGSPVAHALSPALHQAAYKTLGLDYAYHTISCTPDQLPNFVTNLDSDWLGFSVTAPLKRAILPYLDTATSTVQAIGAANTIILTDRQFRGDNTDLHGMLQSLRDADITGAQSACVLGAGATAATALAALRRLGCDRTTVLARDPARTTELAEAAERIGITVDLHPFTHAERHLQAELVISTVPPGATDHLTPHWPAPTRNVLLDVTYLPWPTPLAQSAHYAGSTIISGRSMLLHQAARQFELHTGHTPAPLATMRTAAERAFSKTQPVEDGSS